MKKLANPDSGDSYVLEEHEGTMYFTADWPYWKDWQKGGPVTLDAGDWAFHPAYVQVRVFNPRAEKLSITSAEIVVEESYPDLKPILVIGEESIGTEEEDTNVTASILNEGWGKVEDCEVRFNILEPAAEPKITDYRFTAKVGTFTEQAKFKLAPAMKELGMDPDLLTRVWRLSTEGTYDPKNVPRALGPLATASNRDEQGRIIGSSGLIAGEVSFLWTDHRGEKHKEGVKFYYTKIFYEFGVEQGAGGPENGRYDVLLPIKGKEYVKRIPYKQVLEPGANDRITLSIASSQSAVHVFRVRFRTSDGGELISRPCRLHFIIPRGAEMEGKDQSL
jgi:hypothetical protein